MLSELKQKSLLFALNPLFNEFFIALLLFIVCDLGLKPRESSCSSQRANCLMQNYKRVKIMSKITKITHG